MFFPYIKAKRILRQSLKVFKKKKNKLTETEKKDFFAHAESLHKAIFSKNKKETVSQSKSLEAFVKKTMRKTSFDHVVDFLGAILFAVVVAFAIREYWFELYEVPTGSMRPTIEELDRLVVSKTTFGLHHPFQNRLFLFNPDYIKRNGIIVFTVEDMDVEDSDTVYFYLFPGKKRFIKRCLGKPGDILYFYGGRVYGVDDQGKEITDFFDEKTLKDIGIFNIDHVPYISFDGKVKLKNPLARGIYGTALLTQMGQELGRLSIKENGEIEGQFFNGKEWVKDQPREFNTFHAEPKTYSDMWGLGNYAMARLLNKNELSSLYGKEKLEEGILFLELHHTPNLSLPPPELRRDEWGRMHPTASSLTTIIPLKEEHLSLIQKALYTARFYVKEGRAYRYTELRGRPQREEYDPLFPKVPNGCYEFENGIAYEIHTAGFRSALPLNHPLYSNRPSHIQKLFNLGINFNVVFEPSAEYQPYMPQRFAYYNQGDLYLMGKPILKKEDPILINFIKSEIEKEKKGSYIAFVDHGPPLKAGKIDKEFIKSFGLKIPQNGVLALGDNYAMSSDSRDFGFVPVHNLRGSPTFIFWPFSSRFGRLPQASYPFWTLPSLLVYVALLLIALGICLFYRKRNTSKNYHAMIQKQKEKKSK